MTYHNTINLKEIVTKLCSQEHEICVETDNEMNQLLGIILCEFARCTSRSTNGHKSQVKIGPASSTSECTRFYGDQIDASEMQYAEHVWLQSAPFNSIDFLIAGQEPAFAGRTMIPH